MIAKNLIVLDSLQANAIFSVPQNSVWKIGWGILIYRDDNQGFAEAYGGFNDIFNGKSYLGEVTAVTAATTVIPQGNKCKIITDSQSFRNSFIS